MRIPYLTLLLVFVTLVIAAVPGAAEALTLNRGDLADGAVVQLWTSHFCHWSGGHLFWDLVVFCVLGAWVELRSWKSFVLLLGAGLPVLAWCAFAFTPAMDGYRGLSGLDSALFGFLAACMWKDAASRLQRIAAGVALAAFAAKSIVELLTGAPVFVSDLGENVIAVPAIHLSGVVLGLALAETHRCFWRIKFRVDPKSLMSNFGHTKKNS